MAVDFLSRTEINPTEKLEINLRNDIQTKAIEVNIQSSGIAAQTMKMMKKHYGNKKTISEIKHKQIRTMNRKTK